jgi:hypothetical protein
VAFADRSVWEHPSLTVVTVEAFLQLLNNRVVMWTFPTRLTNLLAAPYRNSIHAFLVLDTAGVVEIYSEAIHTTHGYEHRRDDLPKPAGAESFMTRVRTCADRRWPDPEN